MSRTVLFNVEALKIAVYKSGLTQREIAYKANLAEVTVSSIINDHALPYKKTLEKICTAINIHPAELSVKRHSFISPKKRLSLKEILGNDFDNRYGRRQDNYSFGD